MLHVDDRDTFRTTLDVVLEHRRGKVAQNFRLRGADGHYHWFALRARPVIGSDGEVIRCVGTMVDVTEQKNPRRGCCTTRCTTTSPACPIANCS